MPTKKELEGEIAKLQEENKTLKYDLRQADELSSEAINQLVLATIQIREMGGQPVTEWKEEFNVTDIFFQLGEKVSKDNESTVNKANNYIRKQASGVKKRSENSLRKYDVMAPFYGVGLLVKGMSKNQAALHAHAKACELDDTIPKKISTRQLNRELDKSLDRMHERIYSKQKPS